MIGPISLSPKHLKALHQRHKAQKKQKDYVDQKLEQAKLNRPVKSSERMERREHPKEFKNFQNAHRKGHVYNIEKPNSYDENAKAFYKRATKLAELKPTFKKVFNNFMDSVKTVHPVVATSSKDVGNAVFDDSSSLAKFGDKWFHRGELAQKLMIADKLTINNPHYVTHLRNRHYKDDVNESKKKLSKYEQMEPKNADDIVKQKSGIADEKYMLKGYTNKARKLALHRDTDVWQAVKHDFLVEHDISTDPKDRDYKYSATEAPILNQVNRIYQQHANLDNADPSTTHQMYDKYQKDATDYLNYEDKLGYRSLYQHDRNVNMAKDKIKHIEHPEKQTPTKEPQKLQPAIPTVKELDGIYPVRELHNLIPEGDMDALDRDLRSVADTMDAPDAKLMFNNPEAQADELTRVESLEKDADHKYGKPVQHSAQDLKRIDRKFGSKASRLGRKSANVHRHLSQHRRHQSTVKPKPRPKQRSSKRQPNPQRQENFSR